MLLIMMTVNKVKTVAIVDDEENLRETVSYALRKEGYTPQVYSNGQEAWEGFQKGLPDLVILDILMPRMDGLELCRKLRGLSEQLPLIFLSSKDEEFDRILGLEIGGDDYLCKPFSMRELMTRVKVLFRRTLVKDARPSSEEVFKLGDLLLDLKRYMAAWKDSAVPLTVTEFMLLQSLASGNGHVKTREQLMEKAYPDNTYVSARTIDSHIKRLRKKMVSTDPRFSCIETVYGLGYRYNP